MAEQSHCAACGLPLRLAAFPGVPVAVATVNGCRYHAICWVMREAPSVRAGAMVN